MASFSSPLADARAAVASIGESWRADEVERARLDFKETPETARGGRTSPGERKSFRRSIAETAACLANAEGGAIVVGIRDRATTRADALQGVDPTLYRLDDFTAAVHSGTVPPLTIEAAEDLIDGKRLVFLRVPRGTVVHSTTDGTYKHRVRDSCVPLASDELRDLQAVRGQFDWSAKPTEFTIDDLSAAALERAAALLESLRRPDLARLATNDPEGFLNGNGLLEGRRIRRAAALMYGKGTVMREVAQDYGALVTTAPSFGSEGAVLMGRADSSGKPLILLIEEILARLSSIASTEQLRVGAVQFGLVDYPEDVARELIANAFAHRDWDAAGVIEVNHSPDELLVSSPGGLLPTMHLDRLLRETAPRNRLLASEIARLHIAEGAGLGFDRVWRGLASLGKPPPRLAAGAHFTVTVPGGRGDSSFVRYLNGPSFPPAFAADLDVLLILSVLRTEKSVGAEAVAAAIQRDVETSKAVLQRMEQNGLLTPTARTARSASPRYRLAAKPKAALRQALTYRVGDIDADDAKLVRHLRRHGSITNEDVRDYLDCDVATARNRLTRMRNKGWIEFAPGSAKRGPAVSYAATAKLDEAELDRGPRRASPRRSP